MAGLEINTATQGMITLSGSVLTAPGGQLEAPVDLREMFAIISDGTMLVANGQRYSARVRSMQVRAEQAQVRIQKVVEVDLATLRRVYQSAQAQRNQAPDKNDVTDTKMRRDLIDIIAVAASLNASDIHITADSQHAQIELRIDSMLLKTRELQIDYTMKLLGAAYAMAESSDASYQPHENQGARIVNSDGKLPERIQAIRLQWNPLVFGGRYLVMRLLYKDDRTAADLDHLGYSKSHLADIRFMRARATGINFISGPTGSGKSTTLKHAIVNLIAERNHEINCVTVEDPPEYDIPFAKQMPVTNAQTPEERDRKFHAAINAALRSDPDAIMIGEIRDLQSARLAFTAAMTGHTVWTSIHANSALGIIDRLSDMGVEISKIADPEVVTGLIGQRLIRRLCPHCRVSLLEAMTQGWVGDDTFERLKTLMTALGRDDEIYARNPAGCKAAGCRRGYRGRTVVAETISPDDGFMKLIRAGQKTEAGAYWLETLNGTSMLAHAVAKMLTGEVSPADIEYQVRVLLHDPSMVRMDEIIRDL